MERSTSQVPMSDSEKTNDHYLALLAEACGHTGLAAEGVTLLAEALAHAHTTGESWTEAELYRLKGELLLALSTDNHAEAEGCFHQAFAVARRQHAKARFFEMELDQLDDADFVLDYQDRRQA